MESKDLSENPRKVADFEASKREEEYAYETMWVRSEKYIKNGELGFVEASQARSSEP